MVLLVSGATRDVRRANPERVGVLFVPRAGNTPASAVGRVWAADNGAYSGFDCQAFVNMLEGLRGVPGCRFVAAPDVVGCADDTMRLFRLWEPMLHALGFPVALVAQDGMRPHDIPWHSIEALFIGGSVAWKLSRVAADLLGWAAARGKHRHVGKVNTRERMMHFWGLADTIDGSGFSRWPTRIRFADRWIAWCARNGRQPRQDSLYAA